MRLRRFSFRTKLIGITALPMVVIGYLALQDVQSALDTRQAAAEQAVELDRQRVVADLADAISDERAALFDPAATDEDLALARSGVEAAVVAIRAPDPGLSTESLAAVEGVYADVADARSRIGDTVEPIQEAISTRADDALVQDIEGFAVLPQQVVELSEFEVVDRQTLANLTSTLLLQRARESLALEGVTLQQALAEGAPSQDTLERLEQQIGSSDEALDVVLDLGEPAISGDLADFLGGPDWADYEAVRNRFTRLLIGQRIRLDPTVLLEERAAVAAEFESLEGGLAATMDQDTAALDEAAARDLTLAVAISAGVFVLLTLFLLLLARSIRRSLGRVESRATEIANEELPSIVRMMRTEGDLAETPSIREIPVESRDEIGRLSAAFNELHRTAINLAGEQAASRAVVAHMFVNLGRRNQKLLMRILQALDDLERNESDPDRLARIYEIDHLATRMRRNAESLLILADADVARRFEGPVKISELLRSTMAEVEEFDRIKLNVLDDVEIVGDTAADLAHLISELTENAAKFSPPSETIEVIARYTRVGYILAVIDNGMGLAENEIVEANARIAAAATSAETPSRNLGHFVVGKLAGKYGMEVEVFDRVPAGLTVRIRIPWSMIVSQPPAGVIEPLDPTGSMRPAVNVAPPDEALSPVSAAVPGPVEHVRGPSPRSSQPAPIMSSTVTTGTVPVPQGPATNPPPPGSISTDTAPLTTPPPFDPAATGPIDVTSGEPGSFNYRVPNQPMTSTPASHSPVATGEIDPVFGTARRVAGANLPNRVAPRPRPEPNAGALRRSAETVGSNLGALQRGLQRTDHDESSKEGT